MAKHTHRRSFHTLFEQARRHGAKGLLHHAITSFAKDINKAGLRRQIQFLTRHLGLKHTDKLVQGLLNVENEVLRLTELATENNRIALLVRLMYDIKIEEAHRLSQMRENELVRFLVRELGLDHVKQLVEGK